MKCRSDQTLQHFLVDISTLSMDKHFPLRLYAMLEYASGSEHGSAIHWTHNGQAFVVSQLDVVVEHVLPVFFNLTKFRSFTSQLNLWGFQRLTLTGENKNLWFHPHFIRGSADGLKHIQRVGVISSDTFKRSPPERRRTFDTSELKRGSALSITSPREMSTGLAYYMASSLATSRVNTGYESDVDSNVRSDQVSDATMSKKSESEPLLVQALDQQLPEATMPGSDALLVQALQEKNQLLTQKIARLRTQKITRLRDKIEIRLIDERIQQAARPMSPTPFPPGRNIRTVEQRRQSEVPMPPSSRPLEHDSMDTEQQQNAGETAFHVTVPTYVYLSPVTFADNAPVQENEPYYSFSSLSSWPQVNVNSSPSSNVGQGTILHGGRIRPPTANDFADDEMLHLISQIIEPSEEISSDIDSWCSVEFSNELEKEFTDAISF